MDIFCILEITEIYGAQNYETEKSRHKLHQFCLEETNSCFF